MNSTGGARRRVTIADIAERAGVSIGAVSFALNGRKGVSETTRAKVLSIADELGWSPASAARSLAESRTETLGLVLTRELKSLSVEPYYMQFIAGLENELASRDYAVLLQIAPDRASELATLAKWQRSRRLDGVILSDLTQDDPRVRLFVDGGLPAIVVGSPHVAGPLSCVWTDDDASMREAVAHLAAFGHRRIARVRGLKTLAHTLIRDAAFYDETARRGIVGTLLDTDYSAEAGAAATTLALGAEVPPTALVYDNDIMALAGLGVAAERGLSVPEDLSIVAWDDSALCEHTRPGLTAMGHDVVETGRLVAREMFRVLDGAEPRQVLGSPPVLKVRGSTGPARP